MYAMEFETDVRGQYIKIPDYQKFKFKHVKVVLMAKETVEEPEADAGHRPLCTGVPPTRLGRLSDASRPLVEARLASCSAASSPEPKEQSMARAEPLVRVRTDTCPEVSRRAGHAVKSVGVCASEPTSQ